MAAAAAARRLCSLDAFALRQFTPGQGASTLIEGVEPEAFCAKVNELYERKEVDLVDGYAPFCKHLFVRNFVGAGAAPSCVRITPENEGLLRTEYVARTEKELPVLRRFIPRDSGIVAPPALFLDVILYSREQIDKENAAMGKPATTDPEPWGIISVKPQLVDYETPMEPITMLRNALGAEEGGSGVPLDREKYMESVAFWKEHATIS